MNYKKPDGCTLGSAVMSLRILSEAVMDYFVFTKYGSEPAFYLHYERQLMLCNSASVLTPVVLAHFFQFSISFDLSCINSFYLI